MTHIRQMMRIFALVGAIFPVHAQAGADAPVASLEFLPGWQTADGTQMAALRVRLADGWKTYWRAPGDVGVPPQFNWAGSGNLRGVAVHWPRPDIFTLNGLRTIGYKHELVLPIELSPTTPGAPISLNLEMALGVCKDICLPMTLNVTGITGKGTGPDSPLIRAALSDQPKSAATAGAGKVTCALEPISDGLRLTASIPLASQGGDEVVILEPGRQDVWVSEALTDRKGGTLTATADLVPPESQPFAFQRSSLRITVLGAKGAVELTGCGAG